MGNMLGIDPNRPPIFIGAGIIKSEERMLYFADEPLLAAQIVGSFSEHEWSGADPSGDKTVFHWDEASQAAYNAIGLKNCGRKTATEFLPTAVRTVREAGQIAIIGVTSIHGEDPTKVLPDMVEWALDMGADGVEINGSCPNQRTHSLLCENVDQTYETLNACRERAGRQAYLMVKMAPLSDTIIRQYRSEEQLAVNAVDVINSYRQLSPLNPVTKRHFIEVNDGYAGQSGPAITELARHNLKMWWSDPVNIENPSQLKSPYDVWSIGGVDNGCEVFQRHNEMGAVMVGGAQAFYRATEPRKVVRRWAEEYFNCPKTSDNS